MSVFRVEKTRDYTVMSNTHLKDKSLSLKAKGLLTQMLSLPDDWDYTLKGLASLNRDGKDAIREAVRELERAGYVVRRRVRDGRGRLLGNEYVIYEQPQKATDRPESGKPALENPTLDNPALENPALENPALGFPALENPTTYKVLTESNTESSNTYGSNPDPIQLGRPPPVTAGWDEMGYEKAREIVKENIDYDILLCDSRYSQDRLDEMVELMAEVLSSRKSSMVIAGSEYPMTLVRDRLMQLTSMHIQYVFDCLNQNTTHIRNIKKYLLATLFNAPTTMDSYYAALVNRDTHNSPW